MTNYDRDSVLIIITIRVTILTTPVGKNTISGMRMSVRMYEPTAIKGTCLPIRPRRRATISITGCFLFGFKAVYRLHGLGVCDAAVWGSMS